MSVLFLPFGDRTDDATSTEEIDHDPSPSPDLGNRAPIDVFVDTGLTPEEFVIEELRASDGPIKQQEFCRRTKLCDSTVSVLLSKMEQSGTIARLQIGAENIVYLPDSPPANVTAREAGGETK